jgi:hypothetical protein
MPFFVKLTCRGTAMRTHPLRTVAQFRYDDGWARTHDVQKRDALLWEPTGDLRLRHKFECAQCSRADVYTSEWLYALLDQARERGQEHVPLG